jgi:RNA polymerase sigma-70 factor (ECF subfamily)
VLARALQPLTDAPAGVAERAIVNAPPRDQRITAMFAAHFDFIWRSLRRLGVIEANVDDAAQEVFMVASRRLDAIEVGKEKSFLFGTAVRVASDARRGAGRRRERISDDEATDVADPTPAADVLVDQKRARALLDEIIASLPDGTGPVFVLYELEGLTMAEIASVLSLAPGTVASRLRRAREHFEAVIARRAPRRDDV